MNFILGSGITGLLAKFILGDDWKIIPFYKSRFYIYSPPLCDNFIIADSQIDSVISALGYSTGVVLMTRAYSSQGNLFKTDSDGALATAWLHKLFDGAPPSHAIPYYKARSSFFVYDKIRANKLYEALLTRYRDELKAQNALGQITGIGPHWIKCGDVVFEYDKIVSTIPLSILLNLLDGYASNFKYRSIHYIHMETKALNFEGASQVLVIDPMFSFYKVSAIAKHRYMFYCHEEINNVGQYFMPIIPGDFDLIDGTMIPNGLMLGEMPPVSLLEDLSIFRVGAFAQHDYCADIGSNILKLVRLSGRDFQPKVCGFKDLTI